MPISCATSNMVSHRMPEVEVATGTGGRTDGIHVIGAVPEPEVSSVGLDEIDEEPVLAYFGEVGAPSYDPAINFDVVRAEGGAGELYDLAHAALR
jgi:hypothetical protein